MASTSADHNAADQMVSLILGMQKKAGWQAVFDKAGQTKWCSSPDVLKQVKARIGALGAAKAVPARQISRITACFQCMLVSLCLCTP